MKSVGNYSEGNFLAIMKLDFPNFKNLCIKFMKIQVNAKKNDKYEAAFRCVMAKVMEKNITFLVNSPSGTVFL